MCFAFSSWTDSLASAMTTLGAKPNHAFFNCQHPSRKKSERSPSNAPCSRREMRRNRLRRRHARSRSACACRKRNIVFKVVLSWSHQARKGCVLSRAALNRRAGGSDRRINGSIRRFFRTGFFSRRTSRIARICANSKTRYAPSATRRVRTGMVSMTIRADTSPRIETGIDPHTLRARRCVEPSVRTAIPKSRA